MELGKGAVLRLSKGYKQTEVGVLPDDWELTRMGEIGDAIIGLTYSPQNLCEHGILVHRSSNIQNNQLAYEDNVYVDVQVSDKLILRENDILICVRNGSRDLIGKSAIIKGKAIGETFGAFMSVFRTEGCAPFIYQSIISNVIQKQINESLGATINQITNKTINEFKLPLPPTLAEQTAIATALSDADALISILEKLIEKKRAIKQGAMQELLKSKEGWSQEPIKCIASISTGAKNTQDKIETGQYPFFVRSDKIERINSYSFDGEAVLVAGDGVGTGKVIHYIMGKFDFHQRVYKISDFQGNIHGYYFFLYFKNNFLYRIMQMTAKSSVDSVRREMIADMIIHFPTYEEQVQIATILKDMDSEIEVIEQNLSKYKMLKQGMMQELLTGKTRLI